MWECHHARTVVLNIHFVQIRLTLWDKDKYSLSLYMCRVFSSYPTKENLTWGVKRAVLCVSNSLLSFLVTYTFSSESLSELLFCLWSSCWQMMTEPCKILPEIFNTWYIIYHLGFICSKVIALLYLYIMWNHSFLRGMKYYPHLFQYQGCSMSHCFI